MTLRRLVLLAVASIALAQWPFGAELAWRKGSRQYDRVKDATPGDERWRMHDKTECYSGTDEYTQRTVFCDAECLRDGSTRNADCAGPWYCAKTKVCQQFDDVKGREKVDSTSRKCAVVKSCANHSQCFPTPAEAERMGVDVSSSNLDRVNHEPFTYKYAGFRFETTCCANKKHFRNDVNMPCNSAAGRRLGAMALVAAGAYGLMNV
mmetsp:Transcript_32728/g.101307  ORF Transcript_32728/g.101307 Transcript_32728/m.101307 type:complete len:207 (+) Transcript_32728:1407-2027(+)